MVSFRASLHVGHPATEERSGHPLQMEALRCASRGATKELSTTRFAMKRRKLRADPTDTKRRFAPPGARLTCLG
jgi:hypothetical protein